MSSILSPSCRLLALAFFLQGASVSAQGNSPGTQWITLSVFNSATQLPVGHFFSSPLHPGLTAGVEFAYNHSAQNRFYQTAKLGYSYHRYVQNTVQLYTEFGYRRAIWQGIAVELRLGGGYLHAIPDVEIFEQEGAGYGKKSNWGRPQGMAGAAFGLSYTLPMQLRLSLDYQFFLQMPFVKQYVPLLPNTLLHVGAALPLSSF